MGRIGKNIENLLRKIGIGVLSIPLTVLPYSCEKPDPPEPPVEPKKKYRTIRRAKQ